MQHRSHYALIVLLAIATGWPHAIPVAAASPTDERAKLRSAEMATKKAAHLYAAKKYTEAGQAAREAQEALGELEKSETKSLAQPLAAMRKSLSRIHDQLTREKIELPELPPALLSAKAGKKQAAADKISFTKQVAPVLVTRCGNCHVQRSRGDFSMATYADLIKGNKDGIVVQPGSGKGSRLYEVIESGDMPKGGGIVLPEELALLVRWIDEGAIFDGQNPADRLSDAAVSPSAPAPAVAATKTPPAKAGSPRAAAADKSHVGSKGSSGSSAEEVLFSRDIAPILTEHCIVCHGDRNPRGQLDMDSFTTLMKGGTTGPPITAGNPTGSLLIEKLQGTAEGKRMPAGKPPLPAETIAKIEAWIAAGAKFDGASADMVLTRLVAVTRAMAATHEQLTLDRAQLTEKNWRLILPDAPANHTETEHFLVYGNMSIEDLTDLGQQAEAQVPKLEKLLKIPAGIPLIKGRMTIYAFQKHYDYHEIGTMLEHRYIPPESRGHWHYDVVDAYAAIVPPKNNEYALDALLAQQIASVYVASQGNVPLWFADGSGRAIAAKINAKDSRVRQWENRLGSALIENAHPTDLLDGKLNPADSDAVSFGFGRYLMSNAGRYYGLLSSLREGAKFDDAFSRAYNGPPKQIIESWAQHGGKRGR